MSEVNYRCLILFVYFHVSNIALFSPTAIVNFSYTWSKLFLLKHVNQYKSNGMQTFILDVEDYFTVLETKTYDTRYGWFRILIWIVSPYLIYLHELFKFGSKDNNYICPVRTFLIYVELVFEETYIFDWNVYLLYHYDIYRMAPNISNMVTYIWWVMNEVIRVSVDTQPSIIGLHQPNDRGRGSINHYKIRVQISAAYRK